MMVGVRACVRAFHSSCFRDRLGNSSLKGGFVSTYCKPSMYGTQPKTHSCDNVYQAATKGPLQPRGQMMHRVSFIKKKRSGRFARDKEETILMCAFVTCSALKRSLINVWRWLSSGHDPIHIRKSARNTVYGGKLSPNLMHLKMWSISSWNFF